MSISTIELERAGVSYTVETLRAIAARHPRDSLFLLLGGDTLSDFPKWREPEEICRMATPLVVDRAGEPLTDVALLAAVMPVEHVAEIDRLRISMPPVDVSSSEIRRRIASGRSIDGLVSAAVAAYIAEHGLYADQA
jgi:nicotinate-nucleotide adenylyltransferase